MVDVETWKNTGRGKVAVIKLDRRGSETHEIVLGGRSFTITTAERLINQDRAATPTLDVFSNGLLIPVRLLDGDETAAEIAANPNLLSDSDLEDMFKAHWRTFEKKIQEINNPITLHRLLEVAEKVDATVKQLGLIQERLVAVDPTAPIEMDVQQVASIRGDSDIRPRGLSGDVAPRPVTPK